MNPNPIISMKTCVDAIAGAMLSRRSALQAELAVGLIVFAIEGEANRQAKQTLNAIYGSAGYQCMSATGIDYKTINRHINVTAALFDLIGAQVISEWLADKAELQAVSAIIAQLEPLQFYTLNDVRAFCGKPEGDQTRQEGRKDAAPKADAGEGKETQPAGYTQAAGAYNRRAEDRQDVIRIDTRTLHIAIPHNAKPAELIEVAMRILALAREPAKSAAKELESVF